MMNIINKKILFNIVGFYICWWGSIWGAVNNLFFIGPICVLLFLFIHLFKIVYNKNEILYLFICFILGFILDTIFLRLEIINYKGYLPLEYNLAPLWVVGLWVCFGATVLHSFKWIRRRYITLFILGAICAPIIYLSASRLETLNFVNENFYALSFVSLGWAIFLPFLIFLSDCIVE